MKMLFNILLIVIVLSIFVLLNGCEDPFQTQIRYEISLTPSNKVLQGENVNILFKITNNFNEIISLEKIEYATPSSSSKEIIPLLDQYQYLDVGKSVLESRYINTRQLQKGIYPITTTLYYIKGNETKKVDLSLNLEVY